jgi:predicted cobalt transporter CbtA
VVTLIGATHQVVLPTDRVERYGSYFSDQEVEQPIETSAHRRDLTSDPQRRDLSGVHERDQEQADWECCQSEEVEDERASCGGGVVFVRLQASQAGICDCHQGCTANQQTTASDAVNEKDGAGCGEELPGLQAAAYDSRQDWRIAQVLLQDCVAVEGNDIDT